MAKKSEELTAEEISALENKKNYYEKWRDKANTTFRFQKVIQQYNCSR